MKILKWLLIALSALVVIFMVGGLLLPSKWTVSENITIKAPVETIYGQVANLRNWQNWSPWTLEKDPTQVYTYEGPEMGVGAKWLWTSEKMGSGSLQIVKAEVEQGIEYDLFIDMGDNKSNMHGSMTFTKTEEGIKVVWSDQGEANNIVQRWMAVMIKSMLSKEFQQGLTKLKSVAEAAPVQDVKPEAPAAEAAPAVEGQPAVAAEQEAKEEVTE